MRMRWIKLGAFADWRSALIRYLEETVVMSRHSAPASFCMAAKKVNGLGRFSCHSARQKAAARCKTKLHNQGVTPIRSAKDYEHAMFTFAPVARGMSLP
jgi:hypothetical protein